MIAIDAPADINAYDASHTAERKRGHDANSLTHPPAKRTEDCHTDENRELVHVMFHPHGKVQSIWVGRWRVVARLEGTLRKNALVSLGYLPLAAARSTSSGHNSGKPFSSLGVEVRSGRRQSVRRPSPIIALQPVSLPTRRLSTEMFVFRIEPLVSNGALFASPDATAALSSRSPTFLRADA